MLSQCFYMPHTNCPSLQVFLHIGSYVFGLSESNLRQVVLQSVRRAAQVISREYFLFIAIIVGSIFHSFDKIYHD